MGTKRTIVKKTGYPTSDGEMFDSYKEAMNHQTDLDLIASCDADDNIDAASLKKYLTKNVDVLQSYIKQHLTKKPAPKKTGDKPQAAKEKTADKKAAK